MRSPLKKSWSKATVGGLVAAVVVGTAGVAVAATETGSTTVPAAATSSAAPASGSSAATKAKGDKTKSKAKKDIAARLKNVQHATWVTKDKDKAGSFITHDLINGDISAVTDTSITVKAEDGVSQTYAITAETKIRVRTGGKGTGAKAAEAKAADLKVGEKAVVTGTGTDSLTATHIVAVAG